jgi:hypothetical protein
MSKEKVEEPVCPHCGSKDLTNLGLNKHWDWGMEPWYDIKCNSCEKIISG